MQSACCSQRGGYASHCCDRKSRAAYAQSFAPWQQATIEIMRRNLSARTEITLCIVIMFNRSHVKIGRATTSQSLLLLFAGLTYIMVLFFAHIPFVVNHTINATPPERLQQHLVCHCFSVRFHLRDFPFLFLVFSKLSKVHAQVLSLGLVLGWGYSQG